MSQIPHIAFKSTQSTHITQMNQSESKLSQVEVGPTSIFLNKPQYCWKYWHKYCSQEYFQQYCWSIDQDGYFETVFKGQHIKTLGLELLNGGDDGDKRHLKWWIKIMMICPSYEVSLNRVYYQPCLVFLDAAFLVPTVTTYGVLWA